MDRTGRIFAGRWRPCRRRADPGRRPVSSASARADPANALDPAKLATVRDSIVCPGGLKGRRLKAALTYRIGG